MFALSESGVCHRTTGDLRFCFNGTDFYFNLMPQGMRAPNYQAVVTGPGGVRGTLSPQPVHIFKGVLAERLDIRGRFNLNNSAGKGVVYAPEGRVYVEPLRNYLPSASAGELVVYRHADTPAIEQVRAGIGCLHPVPDRIRQGRLDHPPGMVRLLTCPVPESCRVPGCPELSTRGKKTHVESNRRFEEGYCDF